MAAPSKLAHVVFRTNQIQAMIEWYSQVLEAHVVFSGPAIAFLTYDDEHHRIALVGSDSFAPAGEKPRVGFYHAAFAYASLADLLDTAERLDGLGIAPWRAINHGPTISFYYEDPDGNDVELQVDRFEDPRDATAMMHSAAFRKNPLGVLVDRTALRAQLDAGLPLHEIMRRTDE
jgi:catechol-2,3-dioxygenase